MTRHRPTVLRLAAALLASALALAGCRSADGSYPPPGPMFGSDDGTR